MADRVLLKRWVTPEAKQGFDAFAAMHGLTVTAILDALGIFMGAIAEGERQISPAGEQFVALARSIANDRRRR